MSSKTGPPMKLLGSRQLSLLLVFTLLLCHGVFGALHLVCYPPQCAGDAEHAADHQLGAGAVSGAHEHPAGHVTSIEYFAVLVVGILGLLLGLLLKGAPLRIGLGTYWPAVLRLVPSIFHPPPTPALVFLRVFRL
jgi:hypothetical protein